MAVVGPRTDRPDGGVLADDLRDELGRSVTVDLRLVVQERELITAE